MGTVRGLKNRLCPGCARLTPHRTLYAKTESGGKTKWLQLFWACEACGALNHVTIPLYRLRRMSSPLPSDLALVIVNALLTQPRDFEELSERMRRGGMDGVPHLFKSDLLMTLEYLKARGIVTEEVVDRTGMVLGNLRATMGGSVHLGTCPEDNMAKLVSLYAKRNQKLIPVGVFCVSCGYRKIGR